MLEFKKYSSIENTFNKEFMERITAEGYGALTYVVQEKVHGANCCFVTDGTGVDFAKRTGYVEAGEKFYNYEDLLARYSERVKGLFSRAKEKYPEMESIFAYGEMMGGKYPHPDVKNDPKVMNIQKGVFYCPNHEFYGFDIYIRMPATGRYLAVGEVNALFAESGFIYAKTLFEGTIEECLAYPNTFQSKVAEWMGLPPIEGNICEGIVIRPAEPAYFGNGARLLLKSKNSKFAEKKSVKKRQPALFVEPTYSNELNALLPATEDYVTENRLDNVISKIGQVSLPKDLGRLIGLFSKDILDDFLKEQSGAYAALEKSEQKILNRHINKLATDLIKKVHIYGNN